MGRVHFFDAQEQAKKSEGVTPNSSTQKSLGGRTKSTQNRHGSDNSNKKNTVMPHYYDTSSNESQAFLSKFKGLIAEMRLRDVTKNISNVREEVASL